MFPVSIHNFLWFTVYLIWDCRVRATLATLAFIIRDHRETLRLGEHISDSILGGHKTLFLTNPL